MQGGTHASDMAGLPALHWDGDRCAATGIITTVSTLRRRGRARRWRRRAGARITARSAQKTISAICFRGGRWRPSREELDGLVAQGVEYVYFIDEIFLPYRDVLELIRARNIKFGMQTRIDLWSDEMIDLLGAAGCVSIEAGVESITRSWPRAAR